MDATAHTVPKGYDVQGYPTLFFLPAGAKKPIAYDGEREASAMEAFIKKNRVTSA
jgi:protein disulfide isomerase family A protein 3